MIIFINIYDGVVEMCNYVKYLCAQCFTSFAHQFKIFAFEANNTLIGVYSHV